MAFRKLAAVVVAVVLLVAPSTSFAAGSSGKGGSSKSSSKSSFGSSKSKSSSKPKSKAGARTSKSAASKAVTIGASGANLPSPPVREDGSVATDLRVRGGYFSETTFAALPCERREVIVGDQRSWRCGDAWFERLVYDEQPLYVEVFAPEGARTDELPETVETIRGESTTYFAADDAIYAPAGEESGGFIVVAASPGFRIDGLPQSVARSVPIVAGNATYYRYLGVYYREVRENGRLYYVASEDPF